MALIPPSFLDTIVALGVPNQDGKIEYNATGFLYGYPIGRTDENGSEMYRLFLVTNRHVFQRVTEHSDKLYARFNKLMEISSNIYPIELTNPHWILHPDNDVAVLGLNAQKLGEDGIGYDFFAGDEQTFTLEQARIAEISEGDGVFVLGFPLGEAGEERNYPIVRYGILARVQDWLKGSARTFLIDASIFPGNSGGPVLLKPETTSIKGTKSNNRCGLIGMVSSYLPYQEVAVSTQTQRPRMIFEENSGLGEIVPHDVIEETIKIAVDNLWPGEEAGTSEPKGQS